MSIQVCFQSAEESYEAITRDEFSPSSVVEELLDGAGVVMLKVFLRNIKRIPKTLEAETDEAIVGSHFNQNVQDLLQRRVWFTQLVELDPTSQVWWKNR